MASTNEAITHDMQRLTLADVVVTTAKTTSVADSQHPPLGLVDQAEDTTAIAGPREKQQSLCSEASGSATFRPNPLSLPLTIQKIYSVAGIRTVLHIQRFSDRTMLTCSQLSDGRIATWLLCKPILSMVPTYQGSSTKNNNIDMDIVPLLGAKDSDVVVYTVLAKRILDALEIGQKEIPILLGLGLPQLVSDPADSPKLFHTIAHLMSNMYLESLKQ